MAMKRNYQRELDTIIGKLAIKSPGCSSIAAAPLAVATC